MKLARIATFAAVALSVTTVLLAQFQVNPRVDNSLYGAANVGSVRYSSNSSVAMRSEVRHAYYNSGALPSDIRMNAAAQGPLASGGAMSYIPPPLTVNQRAVAPAAQGANAFTTGSVSRPTVRSTPNQSYMMPSGTQFNSSIKAPKLR